MSKFNKTLYLAQFHRHHKNDTSPYDKVLKTVTDYSGFVSGSEEDINVPKFTGNEVKTGALLDGDFVEGTKDHFVIPLESDVGGISYKYPFLNKPFERRNTPANYYAEHASEAAKGFKRAYATEIMNQIISGTTATQIVNITDGGNDVTLADFQYAHKTFNVAELDPENRFCLINPELEASLYEIDAFISVDKMGKVAIPDGAIGKIMNFWIIVVNTPKVNTSGAIDATPSNNTQNTILFYSKHAIGFALDPFTNITEQPDAKTGYTWHSLIKRGGVATAFDYMSIVMYEN